MYMYIIMYMNIYIKPAVEEKLRRYDGSMSGLVNRLLEEFFKGNPSAATGAEKPSEWASQPGKYPRVDVYTSDFPEESQEKIPPTEKNGESPADFKTYDLCKHNAVKGLCKKGCRWKLNYQNG